MNAIGKRFLQLLVVAVLVANTGASLTEAAPAQQDGSADPPGRVVKLIFIHHSTGENWLADGYGDLGRTLGENNYFVSDTNYGWGPEGIGDRTDIPDWQEWFAGENTELYMAALFNESGQHSDYTRTLADPGGENEIVLFKSCFPNSDLEGSPDDPPSQDGWLSVGHAKYVYNQILGYFGQHPEKLFVVITAPPLSDRSNAANARAFNLWLVNDWLEENDYPYQNVAVFDFYNILTGKDGHHTFENGEEVHQTAGKDTLSYPSGDDHPSAKGSQKATVEFIPLLNYFYNRWQAGHPAALDDSGSGGQAGSAGGDAPALTGGLTGVLDDFEAGPPADSSGWEAYWDEGTASSLACGVEAGAGASGSGLRLDYHITPYAWGTCGLSFDSPQDWSHADGLRFSLHAGSSGGILHVDLYAEGPDGRQSYVFQQPLDSAAAGGWAVVAVPWESFQRVEWEADPGSPFGSQDQVSGLAFGFGTEDDEVQGVLWIDDLGWLGAEQGLAGTGVVAEEAPEAAGIERGSGLILLVLIGLPVLLMIAGGVVFILVRRSKSI